MKQGILADSIYAPSIRKDRCFENFCGWLFQVDNDDLTDHICDMLYLTDEEISGEEPISQSEEANCFDDLIEWLLEYPGDSYFIADALRGCGITKYQAAELGFDSDVCSKMWIAANSRIRRNQYRLINI